MTTMSDPQTVIAPTEGAVPYYVEKGNAKPRAVKGRFRDYKWWAMIVLLGWWHLAPFLRWDRGPGAPDQAILIDMPGRRAYFFFLEIWPQEVYYITGILLIAAVALFLMSALAGRVWCGFLCWQTVYTDLFVQVERMVLGRRTQRIALSNAPWTADKVGKWAAVVALWFVLSAACGIGFTLWFGDAFEMLRDIFSGDASFAVYMTILVIGGFCLLLGGFARERVCVYMCPYARFQSAMFDEHSLIVSYEAWRGEPRAPAPKDGRFEGRGHCVDCGMCVQSCPTGIDIRRGNQLACIGCALCSDACNTVMERFGLPRGLISYDSSANMAARGRGEVPPGIRPIRPRTLIYVAIIAVVGLVMLFALVTRSTTEVNVLHERSPLFVQLSDGGVRNGYVYKILNMIAAERTYTLRVEGIPGATLDVVGEATGQDVPLTVARDSVGTFRLYVSAPEAALAGKSTPVVFVLTAPDGSTVRNGTVFAGPVR